MKYRLGEVSLRCRGLRVGREYKPVGPDGSLS